MSDVVNDLRMSPVTEPERLAAAMTRAVGAADRSRGAALPAVQVLIRAPGFEFASGERERRFHGASIGKAITATRVFQLAEAGRLDLDAPISTLLPADDWRGLFVGDRHDPAVEVTTAHLLTHTSGAADYFEGRTTAPMPFAELVAAEPERRWTPADLLAYSREFQRPVAAPGRRFAYSDTGYVLLGRIIEEAGGATLGEQLHQGVLGPAGMTQSCLLFHTLPGGAASTSDDPAAVLDIAPLWLGRHELSRARSLSCDWGGGGVVTTPDDLTRFTIAWSDGSLIGAASRARMRDARRRFRPGIRYGAGLMELRYEGFSPFLRGMPRPVGHIGVTATHAFTVPERGIHVSMNFHSTREMIRSFRVQIRLMQLLMRALRP